MFSAVPSIIDHKIHNASNYRETHKSNISQKLFKEILSMCQRKFEKNLIERIQAVKTPTKYLDFQRKNNQVSKFCHQMLSILRKKQKNKVKWTNFCGERFWSGLSQKVKRLSFSLQKVVILLWYQFYLKRHSTLNQHFPNGPKGGDRSGGGGTLFILLTHTPFFSSFFHSQKTHTSTTTTRSGRSKTPQ